MEGECVGAGGNDSECQGRKSQRVVRSVSLLNFVFKDWVRNVAVLGETEDLWCVEVRLHAWNGMIILILKIKINLTCKTPNKQFKKRFG